MPNRIGTTLAATSVVIALAGCGQTGPSEPDVAAPSGAGTSAPTGECAPTPAADVTTAEGWIGYLAENFDTVAIAVDDGNGGTFEQRPDERQPLASAVKVVHLAAYARAVAAGELSPTSAYRSPTGNAGISPTPTAAHTPGLSNGSV